MDRRIRTGRPHIRLALTGWVVVMALAALSLFLRLWNSGALDMAHLTGAEVLSEVLWWLVLIPAAVPAYATVGAIIAARRPRNGIGWLLLLGGFAIAVQDAAWQWAARALAMNPGSLPGGIAAAWIGELFGSLLLAPLTVSLLLFPSGMLPSRRWRPAVWMIGVAAVLTALSAALNPTLSAGLIKQVPNPLTVRGLDPLVAVANEAGTLVSVLTVLAAVVSVFLRWRRTGGVERQQLKWLAYIASVGAVTAGLAIASGMIYGPSYQTVLLASLAIASATIGVPVAVGLAILRYRLYDVDTVINRTLVYAPLTVSLAVVYIGTVILLQYLFRSLTGGSSQLAVVASTLAIAALFNPMRKRIQSFIDRRFYRRKYNAAKVLENFSVRLRDEVELDQLGDDLLSVIHETLQPAHVSLWLRPSAGKGEKSGERNR